MPNGVEAEIVRLGAQADGVAALADGDCFVPFALPGEVWRIGGDRRGELVRAHAERQPPRCPHYTSCGGCQAQHMPAALYRDWKRGIVVEAFRHRGLEPEVAGLVEVTPRSRRRAVFAVLRGPDGVAIGFREAASHTLVDIVDCAVLSPALLSARAPLAELAQALLPVGGETRAAVLGSTTGLAIDLTIGAFKPTAAHRTVVARIAEQFRLAEVTINRDVMIRRAAPRIVCGRVAVVVPPAAFVQAVPEAEQAMAALVVSGIGKARRVADLFAGLGTFALTVAPVARVLAVETERALLQALDAAARHAQGLKPIETLIRDLYREPLARKELESFDAVILDPPRAGAQAQSEMLARSKVPLVVMVSCNPATMARDCRILVDGGYRLGLVTPVDQFLWSHHVEAVAVLSR